MPMKRRDLCWFYRIVAAMDFLVWQWKCLVAKFCVRHWIKIIVSLSTERNPAIRVPRNLMWKFPSKWSTTERLRINCKLSLESTCWGSVCQALPTLRNRRRKFPNDVNIFTALGAGCPLPSFFPPGPPTDKMGERLWTVREIEIRERNICLFFLKKKQNSRIYWWSTFFIAGRLAR